VLDLQSPEWHSARIGSTKHQFSLIYNDFGAALSSLLLDGIQLPLNVLKAAEGQHGAIALKQISYRYTEVL
jgi:hypothetical protein